MSLPPPPSPASQITSLKASNHFYQQNRLLRPCSKTKPGFVKKEINFLNSSSSSFSMLITWPYDLAKEFCKGALLVISRKQQGRMVHSFQAKGLWLEERGGIGERCIRWVEGSGEGWGAESTSPYRSCRTKLGVTTSRKFSDTGYLEGMTFPPRVSV